jgi:gluconate kinase
MSEQEMFFDPDAESAPSEEEVEQLRRKLEAAEKAKGQNPLAAKEGKPVTDEDRQSWRDELDALRAASQAKIEDKLELRGSNRYRPHSVLDESLRKHQEKKVATKVDEK